MILHEIFQVATNSHLRGEILKNYLKYKREELKLEDLL